MVLILIYSGGESTSPRVEIMNKVKPGDRIVFIDSSYIEAYSTQEYEVMPCPTEHKDNGLINDKAWVYIRGKLYWLLDERYEVVNQKKY